MLAAEHFDAGYLITACNFTASGILSKGIQLQAHLWTADRSGLGYFSQDDGAEIPDCGR
jgi:hypothetical protein